MRRIERISYSRLQQQGFKFRGQRDSQSHDCVFQVVRVDYLDHSSGWVFVASRKFCVNSDEFARAVLHELEALEL